MHAFLSERAFLDIARVIEGTLEATDPQPVRSFDDLYEADAVAREQAAALVSELAVEASSLFVFAALGEVSAYVLAFLGFSALIILHEFGHFTVAKLTGMRVERFALFFPPLIVKVRRGETEYGIGAIPLGGFVKITGMNPEEDLPPEVAPRAYYHQPVWKRVVVILAGPFMNLLIAFFILFGLSFGAAQPTPTVDSTVKGSPAEKVLQPGDRILSVDGKQAGEGPDDLTALNVRSPRIAAPEGHATAASPRRPPCCWSSATAGWSRSGCGRATAPSSNAPGSVSPSARGR